MNSPEPTCQHCGESPRPGITFCERCGSLIGRSPTSAHPEGLPDPPRPAGNMSQPEPGDIAAVLHYRAPNDPAVTAVNHFRLLVLVAGITMVTMAIIGGTLSHGLLALWIISGAFVGWRCLVSVPSSLHHLRYHEARRKVLLPAFVSIGAVSVIPGVLLLVAYFTSKGMEDAPPFHLNQGL